MKENSTIIINETSNEEDERVPFQKPSNPDFVTTGEQLINMKQEKLDYLIEGLLPKTGVIALVGSSDTGKSSFLRQLAQSIVYKDADFLGFSIKAKHNSVIYVSTEDDNYAMAYLLNKQKVKDRDAKDLAKLRFIFDSDDIIKKLEIALQNQTADMVIIDTFTDIYSGDLVASNKVRSYINDFVNLSKKFNCLFVFLHHTGKRTESYPPSKDNILGSQGFEAKMRLVMELRRDFADPSKRHLCIVKGNYVRDKDKLESYVLQFDDNMRYANTGSRVAFHLLIKPEDKPAVNAEAKSRAIELKNQGYSISDITGELAQSGYKVSRATVGTWVKKRLSIQSTLGEMDGQADQETIEESKEEETSSIHPIV